MAVQVVRLVDEQRHKALGLFHQRLQLALAPLALPGDLHGVIRPAKFVQFTKIGGVTF